MIFFSGDRGASAVFGDSELVPYFSALLRFLSSSERASGDIFSLELAEPNRSCRRFSVSASMTKLGLAEDVGRTGFGFASSSAFFDADADAGADPDPDTFADIIGVDNDSPNRLARSARFTSSVTAKPNLAARCLRFSISSGVEGVFTGTGATGLAKGVTGLGGSGICFAGVDGSFDSAKDSFVNLKPEGLTITSVSAVAVLEGDGGRTGEDVGRGFTEAVTEVVVGKARSSGSKSSSGTAGKEEEEEACEWSIRRWTRSSFFPERGREYVERRSFSSGTLSFLRVGWSGIVVVVLVLVLVVVVVVAVAIEEDIL